MKNEHQEKWMLRIISIFIATLLFLYVHYENTRTVNSYRPGSGASVNTEEVVENVPIEVKLDTSKYFISGVPESATVRLKGPQSVISQYLATQTLVARTTDLNELGVGTHDVSLHIKDLPKRVSAEIEPSKFEVTIENKVTKEYNVEVVYDESSFEDGVIVGKPELSQQTVTVSGRESEVDEIDRVAVIIPPAKEPYRENVVGHYPVVAQDANRQLVDVKIEPTELNVVIPVQYSEKIVPIRLENKNASDDYDYDIKIASGQMTEVSLKGPQSVLNRIKYMPLEVNLEGIQNSTTRTIDLSQPDGIVEMSIDAVTVVIDVTAKNPPSGSENNSSDESTEENKSKNQSEESSTDSKDKD